MAEEDFEFEEFEEFQDLEEEEPAGFDFEDEFDRLREKTARTSAVYDDMELDDEFEDEEPQGFFSQITPGQRLILLVLLLLDIVVIAIGAMALFDII
ncbi:MAG TPA: hypothetical protein VK879_07695 [Candidatus Sulfomarinibacteraceae bacterium]|nr:hypothetical protein [Candidatus Sulfomarinibacteraceae bacterium]